MTKFCCANTILSPTTRPEKNLVKHPLAKNSESTLGARKSLAGRVQGTAARKRWYRNSVGLDPTELCCDRLRAGLPCTSH